MGVSEIDVAQVPAPDGLTVSEPAKSKLEQHLSGESKDTRVRITAEAGRWGLALDQPGSGWTSASWLMELSLLPKGSSWRAWWGLTIGFVEDVEQAGFSLDGGQPPAPAGKASRARGHQDPHP